MKVIVFGAYGKNGTARVSASGGSRAIRLRPSLRSVSKIDGQAPDLQVAQGDVTDADSVAASVAGHDAAIITLGSNGLRDKTTLSVGTRNVLDGMMKHEVGRLVVLSAAGVGESWRQIPWLARIMFRTMLRNIYADHVAQEKLVRESSLDWTDSSRGYPERRAGHYRRLYGIAMPVRVGHINRADLALVPGDHRSMTLPTVSRRYRSRPEATPDGKYFMVLAAL